MIGAVLAVRHTIIYDSFHCFGVLSSLLRAFYSGLCGILRRVACGCLYSLYDAIFCAVLMLAIKSSIRASSVSLLFEIAPLLVRLIRRLYSVMISAARSSVSISLCDNSIVVFIARPFVLVCGLRSAPSKRLRLPGCLCPGGSLGLDFGARAVSVCR